MLICYKNALKLGGSLVASSENPYYPASNISDYLAYRVWRSGTTNATETLTITLDRNYSSEVIYLVLAGFDFSGLSGITYKLGSDPAVSILGYTNGVTFITPINVAVGPYTTLVLTFTKTSNANYAQVGKIFIGNGFSNRPLDDIDSGGFSRTFFSQDNKDYSLGGQKYAEKLFMSVRAKLTIPYLPEQNMQDTVRAWLLAVGTAVPFFIQIDDYPDYALSSATMTQPYYVTISNPPDEAYKVFSNNGFLWMLGLQLEEQL